MNFVQGSLAGSLSVKLDSARAPFKALRGAEANLQPKRNIRSGIQVQISRFEHDQQKGNETKIADLREQLKRAEAEDQQLEKDVEILKRKAIRESEQIKWDAIREVRISIVFQPFFLNFLLSSTARNLSFYPKLLLPLSQLCLPFLLLPLVLILVIKLQVP